MTGLSKSFYINTGKDGILGDTTPDDVDALVANLKDQDKIVLHFHGGMVTKKNGKEGAAKLLPHYQAAGAYPVFFVWESFILDVMLRNLDEINKEKIFKKLVSLLVKFAVGKLMDVDGGKATGQLQLPDNIEVAIELEKLKSSEVPYADLAATEKLQQLNENEKKNFEQSLLEDQSFQKAVRDIVTSSETNNQQQETNAKGILTLDRSSAETLMSPQVIEELKDDVAANQGKGVLSTALLIKRAGEILVRVIQRFIEKRDHGVYTTVVEEILRDLYLANVGGSGWQMMKKETVDTFENVGNQPVRGGWYFVEKLGEHIQEIPVGQRPHISLVGHSAGSIYICNLLRYVEKVRKDPNHPLPEDFQFNNVIFQAPGVDYKLFSEIVKGYTHLFENFRMFTMKNDGESQDAMVPLIYPRSILYFVSGVVERDPEDPEKSAYDRPIVGMHRYFEDEDTYQDDDIATVRAFLSAQDRSVWAIENRGPGLASSAVAHRGYALEDDTLKSVQHILKEGML